MTNVYLYDVTSVRDLLAHKIQALISPENWNWISEKALGGTAAIRLAFAAIPRKVGKAPVQFNPEEQARIQQLRPGLSINEWPIDRVCRIWLLLHLSADDEDQYVKEMDTLFLSAEMNELVALYSALPLLAHPQAWRKRCAEGIRSNIGDVLQAIICNNPYPSEQLDQKAWNQLVLKAFFTEKPVHQIVHLDQRANEELAFTLSDYAHERWAAGRTVNPLLWRCVGKFMNERIFPDIQRICNSAVDVEKEAGALACWDSSYEPAKDLLAREAELKEAIEDGTLNWDIIAQKI